MKIEPTQHERNEWKRYAKACKVNGKLSRSQFFTAITELSMIDVKVFDMAQALYRKWLVFGEVA